MRNNDYPNRPNVPQLEYNQQYNSDSFQQNNQQGYQGYQGGHQGPPPPKKGLSGLAIGLIIAGVLFVGGIATFSLFGLLTTAGIGYCEENPTDPDCVELYSDSDY